MANRIIGPQAQPELRDVLLRAKQDVSYSLNCVQIGTIRAYDPNANTANVTINFQRQLPTGEIIPYPELQSCPVFFLSGGSSYISLPIEIGDTCLVLFCDRDLDSWWKTGEVNIPATPRAHSLSDGIVLVGIRSQANKEALTANGVMVHGGNQKIVVRNNLANLKILVDTLIDSINAIIVTTPGGNGTVSPASQAAILAVKTQFQLLLSEGL